MQPQATAPTQRATPEERLEAWLAGKATDEGFRGDEALRYMDALRGSLMAQQRLASYRGQEVVAQMGISTKEAVERARRFGERMRALLP